MQKILASLAVAVLTLPLASCSDSGDSGSSPTGKNTPNGNDPAILDTSRGSCHVTVTGGISAEWRGSGGSEAVGSDYWMTEEQLRSTYGQLYNPAESPSFEEMMAAQRPIVVLLSVNCKKPDSTPGASLDDYDYAASLLAPNSATRADVPMAPGTYTIAKGLLGGGSTDPRAFGAIANVGDGIVVKPKGGSLVISRWDDTGIAGTWKMDLVESFGEKREATLVGEFDFDAPY